MSNSKSFPNALPFIWMTGLLFALLGAYSLPWIITYGVAMQANAYDLAEWMTLHPTVRATSPNLLLPSLLLRVNLWLVGLCSFIIFAKSGDGTRWGWRTFPLVLSAGVWVALLPSVNFFTGQCQDTNYLQQFILWSTYPLMGVLVLWLRPRWVSGIFVALALFAMTSSAYALSVSQGFMARYEIRVQFGLGGMLYIGLWLAIIVLIISPYITQKRG